MKKFVLISLLLLFLVAGCAFPVSNPITKEEDLNKVADLVDATNNADKEFTTSLMNYAEDQIKETKQRTEQTEKDLQKKLDQFNLDQHIDTKKYNLDQQSNPYDENYTLQKLQNTNPLEDSLGSFNTEDLIKQQEKRLRDKLSEIAAKKQAELDQTRQQVTELQRNNRLGAREEEALQKLSAWINSEISANQEYIKVAESLTLKQVSESCKPERTTREQTGNLIITTTYFKCTILKQYEHKVTYAKQQRKAFEDVWKKIHHDLFGYDPLHADTGMIEPEIKNGKLTGYKLYTDFSGKKRKVTKSNQCAGRNCTPNNLPGETIQVPFDQNGFPDWKQWRAGEFKLPRKLWQSSDDQQFKQLNQQLYNKMKTDPNLARKVEDGFFELIQKGAGVQNKNTQSRMKRYFQEHPALSQALDKIDPNMKKDLLAGKGSQKLYDLIQQDFALKKLFQDANEKWAKENKVPLAFTWNHHQIPGKMELVQARIHNNVPHTGGRSIWGGGNAKR
ncbi:DNase/tRNase domain of colicin-like bacteriocin [Seinonella peptonophila]|uniref:DNase/tRNase domain of colicin-like bacteriocin n=1 Tax=Seinonella peptonophila TaxID=112248 RepID=A0A1M4ZVR7_9BACL|nr:HNH endonuclease [Seinonella peptonophila]SHF22109.1 DNase/tRNase domain of colicin-like bacteriocin [Seinonella peptonophila]